MMTSWNDDRMPLPGEEQAEKKQSEQEEPKQKKRYSGLVIYAILNVGVSVCLFTGVYGLTHESFGAPQWGASFLFVVFFIASSTLFETVTESLPAPQWATNRRTDDLILLWNFLVVGSIGIASFALVALLYSSYFGTNWIVLAENFISAFFK